MEKQKLYQGILSEDERDFITGLLREAVECGIATPIESERIKSFKAAKVLARIDFKFSDPLIY